MLNLNVPLLEIEIFLFIFLRVGAILMTLPVFGGAGIPAAFKIGLSFTIAILLYPILQLKIPVELGVISLSLEMVSEIILGAIIGLSVRMMFAAVQLAGQLVGFQMGLAMANVIDPSTSEQLPLLGELNNIVAILIFLTINAHHWFLLGVADSFRLVPPFSFRFTHSLMEELIAVAGNMFVIAVKVGAPVIAALFLMSVAFGVAARAVPQMNIFFVALPVQILVGLLFMSLSFPYFLSLMRTVFEGLQKTVFHMLSVM
ncbi:MAG: flagellar biosynthetic protein FliR [Deltaproteobacteria bacterium]|nr:flagellar biosynthetic protein FliR [Deltaproteobacteria bacterium]